MRASSSRKWTLLAIIVGRLGILCVTTAYMDCPPPPSRGIHICIKDKAICRLLPEFHDCPLPQFQCSGSGGCILRYWLCDGIKDCNDGSDEWGCDTTVSDSATTSTTNSESVENTFSYITTTSTMLGGNEEKTTSVILPEPEENAVLSSSATTGTMLPESEENAASLSTTTSTMLPHSELNTVLSSSTTTSKVFPDSVSNTAQLTSTTTKTMITDTESNTAQSTSTTTKTMITDSESNTAQSTSTTTKTMITDSESNTSLSSLVADNTILPESAVKASSPATSTIFPDSSARQSCPDNYCMQNSECIVVQEQYLCKCPSSFSGELCEIQLGTEQGSHEYAVAIVIFMTLVILCLAVVSVCIYRHKRLSAWKSGDSTTRTLSQLTLTFNAVE